MASCIIKTISHDSGIRSKGQISVILDSLRVTTNKTDSICKRINQSQVTLSNAFAVPMAIGRLLQSLREKSVDLTWHVPLVTPVSLGLKKCWCIHSGVIGICWIKSKSSKIKKERESWSHNKIWHWKYWVDKWSMVLLALRQAAAQASTWFNSPAVWFSQKTALRCWLTGGEVTWNCESTNPF